jgi:hypothetical protein
MDELNPGDAASVAAPSAKAPKKIKARVLVDGAYGRHDDVVELSAEEIKAGELAGELDSDKAAVAYASIVKSAG